MRRLLAAVAISGTTLILAGCALVQGPPHREDTFHVADGECTAWWWLGQLQSGVPREAEVIAADALESATITDTDREEWESILVMSQSEGEELSPNELEGQAHIEVVRAHVRDELDEAGYPDSNRVIEVWSDLRCD